MPERRLIDGKWLSYYGDNNFVEYVDNEWKPVSSETDFEELKQKWNQIGPSQQSTSTQPVKCVFNGVTMIWNPMGQVIKLFYLKYKIIVNFLIKLNLILFIFRHGFRMLM